MRSLAAAVAAGLLVAAAPEPPALQGDARVDAGTAVYDLATGTYRLEGGVVIRRGLVTLRARQAAYDPRSGEVTAAGGVLLSDATRVLAAEGLRAVLGGDLTATGVVAFLKDGPVDLGTAATTAEAAACGRNRITASASSLSGRAGKLELTDAKLSLCDCPGGGAPSWQLRAKGATVSPGERVELTWPVLYVTPRFLGVDHPVPVLPLPWLSLPLGDRVSGLLAPQVGYDGIAGLTLELPWFQVLGPSFDLTAAPRYAFGPWWGEDPREGVVRGPGGALELRWAPWEGAGGRIQVDVLWDLADEADPAAGIVGAHGLRLALRGDHAQRLDPRTDLRLDLDLVGDPLYVRDFTPDVLLRDAAVRRSALLLGRRLDDATLELSAAWLQPVSSRGSLAVVDRSRFGASLPGFHRWPALSAQLLPVALAGPLRLSGRAGLSRFAPARGATSDGGLDGIGPGEREFAGAAPDLPAGPGGPSSELDGRWQPGERLAATRLDARAELMAPFLVGGALSVVPFVRGAVLGYAFDAGRDPLVNGWALGGLSLSTVLSRRFGGVRHALEPRLDWRLGGGVLGRALPAFGYDQWDRAPAVPPGAAATFRAATGASRLAAAAPPGPFHQARLSLATRLSSGEKELFRAEVGQDLELRRGRLAEGYVTAAAARGPVSGDAELRFWTGGRLEPAPRTPPGSGSWLDAFSQARLRLGVSDARGDAVRLGLLSFGPGGSGQQQAGADALFDPRAVDVGTYVPPEPGTPGSTWSLASATVGAQVRLGPATIGYEAQLPVRTAIVPACSGAEGAVRTIGPWLVRQHTGSLVWDSPCRCFRARASIRYSDCGGVGGGFTLDLGATASP